MYKFAYLLLVKLKNTNFESIWIFQFFFFFVVIIATHAIFGAARNICLYKLLTSSHKLSNARTHAHTDPLTQAYILNTQHHIFFTFILVYTAFVFSFEIRKKNEIFEQQQWKQHKIRLKRSTQAILSMNVGIEKELWVVSCKVKWWWRWWWLRFIRLSFRHSCIYL